MDPVKVVTHLQPRGRRSSVWIVLSALAIASCGVADAGVSRDEPGGFDMAERGAIDADAVEPNTDATIASQNRWAKPLATEVVPADLPTEPAILASLDRVALADMFADSRRAWYDQVYVGMPCDDVPEPTFANDDPKRLPPFVPGAHYGENGDCLIVYWRLSAYDVWEEFGVDLLHPSLPDGERGQPLYDDDMNFVGMSAVG